MRVPGIFGDIQVISLKKFLSLVPFKEFDQNTVEYNSLLGQYFDDYLDSGVSDYQKNLVKLRKPRKHPLSGAMSQLKNKTYKRDVDYENPKQLLYRLAQLYLSTGGVPAYAVRVDRRTFMVTNIHDFMVFKNQTSTGIGLLAKYRTKIYRIGKSGRAQRVALLKGLHGPV